MNHQAEPEVWNYLIVDSYDQGVKQIRENHAKLNYKNASDMTKEELEKIMFKIRMTSSTFAIDETDSVIEI